MRPLALVALTLVPSWVPAAAAPTAAVADAYETGVAFGGGTYVATATHGAGLAVFAWTTFEGDPFAATLVVLGGGRKPLKLSGVWSAALDEAWERVAVGEELTVTDATIEPPYSRADKVSRDLNIAPNQLEDILYYDAFAGSGYVTRPVIYTLKDGERKALAAAGGDFLDWADGERLVVGREISGGKSPGTSRLALFGFNLQDGAFTTLATAAETPEKLNGKLAAGLPHPPYLAAAWRAVPGLPTMDDAGRLPASVPVPTCGGAFENAAGGVFWRADDGARTFCAEGTALAAGEDGTWLLVARSGPRGDRLVAERMTWK